MPLRSLPVGCLGGLNDRVSPPGRWRVRRSRQPRSNGLSSQRLQADQRRPAKRVVVLAPALDSIAVRLIEPDRGGVLRINIKPDYLSARGARRAFDAAQQLAANALAPPIRTNLDGLNVRNDAAPLLHPLDDGEAADQPVLL